jgi:hypothetical protein
MDAMQTETDIQDRHDVSLRSGDGGNMSKDRTVEKRSSRIAIGKYILRGRGQTIELLITERKRDGKKFLTFPKGVCVSVGGVMNIIRPANFHLFGISLNRGVMKVIGKVRVVGIAGDDRVEVRLLDGKLLGGTLVERVTSE